MGLKPIFVTILCLTYNHESYIRQCLDGFVMQQTNFRFEAIVHDDASTDGTTDIIREYAEKYPDIIKPIYETDNQYSKHDGSLARIMNAAIRGRYVAFCEGDDYWTDPLKLQKQVDYLENHSDYSYVWTNAKTQKECRLSHPYNRYSMDCDVSMEDVIMQGGLWIPTVSIVVRKDILNSRPQNAKFHVGDYPMQIWGAYKGKVRYLADVTCVYRLFSVGSWGERMSKLKVEQKTVIWEKEHFLLKKMDELTELQYHHFFTQRWHLYSFFNLLSVKKYHEAREHWEVLDEKYKKCKLRNCEIWFVGHGVFYIARFIVSIKSLLRWSLVALLKMKK